MTSTQYYGKDHIVGVGELDNPVCLSLWLVCLSALRTFETFSLTTVIYSCFP